MTQAEITAQVANNRFAAQCMRENADLCFQYAHDKAMQIGALNETEKLRMGADILRALRGVHVHSTLAQEPPWPLVV